MSAIRQPVSLRSSFLHPFLRPSPRTSLQATSQRFASGDYGSGEGNSTGENSQKQGSNPSADKEHPGPPSPKAGQGTGAGPTKGLSDGNNTRNSKQSSSPASSGGSKKGIKGAQPKILHANPPTGEDESESVRQHNKEMEGRAEKAHERVSNMDAEKDKVPAGFWSGQGGKDKDP
ncbi:hypothetical protein K432DRAFT_383772 [Lepidopterella palustris CBS 459.81]|uniref:Uncharacterized protein n=1 Tax=Lepidopterella palustris CBS 459.81 TaxID=1314670 RepID=A0A8E2E710_9PEZI|nr:hypothetical protein K432DRAFT_383772 [Lepidopterella palustris CBS 459.81]